MEATEDMLKMAGAGEGYVETQSVLRSTRIRLPWLFASCLGGLVAQLKYSTIELAISVGLGLICSMSVAALFGSMMPMVFAKINIDPAVATGPFVTTSIDIISVLFYFFIATTLLGL